MMAFRRIFVVVAFATTAKAWEIPEFLSANLPTFDATSNEVDREANMVVRDVQEVILPFTDSPTESPAPSPSPSEEPTINPTITGEPTAKPTESPTESPAPSPSPSENPTLQPSDYPSVSPSNAPSISRMPSSSPSVSPSDHPSALPSASPSNAPSVSMAPSSQPSIEPTSFPSVTPSVSPSSAPTHATIVSATFTGIRIPIDIPRLNITQVSALEAGTSLFLEQNATVATGRLDEVVVTLKGQRVIEVKDHRQLMLAGAFDVQQALEVNFTVLAMYIGSDMDFDMYDSISVDFEEEREVWFEQLAASDIIFQSLSKNISADKDFLGDLSSVNTTPTNSSGRGGRTKSTVTIVALLTVSAVALGMAASLFAVRQHSKSVYGQSLGSPRRSLGNSTGTGSKIARENEEYFQKSTYDQGSIFSDDKDDDADSSWFNHQPASPNSLEKGSGGMAFDEIMQNRQTQQKEEPKEAPKSNSWDHIQKQYSSASTRTKEAKDPPTAASEANFASTQDNLRNNVSLFDNNTVTSDLSKGRMSHGLAEEQNREIQLTHNRNGRLGAAQVDGSNVGSGFSAPSEFSSHARSFFEGLVKKRSLEKEQAMSSTHQSGFNNSMLGASSPEPQNDADLQWGTSYDSMSRRAGLYDVFAPAGPIGIVVDTTKHGPAVHSLKRTSPMLGLINPGDLIVGLDDEDTRGMTAATLTRMMARKSSQKERKITLLTGENF